MGFMSNTQKADSFWCDWLVKHVTGVLNKWLFMEFIGRGIDEQIMEMLLVMDVPFIRNHLIKNCRLKCGKTL